MANEQQNTQTSEMLRSRTCPVTLREQGSTADNTIQSIILQGPHHTAWIQFNVATINLTMR